MDAEEKIHIGKVIKAEMERQGRSPSWFARVLNYERSNIYNIYERESIDTELLMKVSKALGVDFFDMYSKRLQTDVGKCSTK
ncbi:MAG: XRE family transcriptional regulator [Bacteroidales bacterium]|nr:XRE family transcriptional regulator [Bacteroidales bacterium]